MDQIAETLAVSIGELIREFTISERRFPAAEGRMRYSGLDFETIAYLSAHPGSRAKDIAGFLGVSATTMQSVIDRLSKRGLVSKDQAGIRGRAVALHLSAEGGKMDRAIKRQNLANCQRMLAALPRQDRERFVQQISRIAAAIAEPSD